MIETPAIDALERVAPKRASNPWQQAVAASEFVAVEDGEVAFLEPPILVPGAITMFFAPRGIGKTLVGLSLAVRQARAGRRVLLLDRDNPPRETRRRLKAWGITPECALTTLRVMTRDAIPPLTEARAWRSFPSADYDIVIVDSWDAFTEGVGEQDSGKPSRATAALLDVVRRGAGTLAALVLGNTVRSGEHSRGSGVIEDRSDIVFEVRDATGWTPTGTKAWPLELPAAGAAAWAERAARRKRQDRYRLAFFVSKFRVGIEPEPFIWELDLRGTEWMLHDVTAAVVAEGEAKRAEVADAKARRVERAGDSLASLVEERAREGRLLKKTDAETYLVATLGLTRDAGRRVIADGRGTRWRIECLIAPGNPEIFLPTDPQKWPAEIIAKLKKDRGSLGYRDGVSADGGKSKPQKSAGRQVVDSAEESPEDPVEAVQALFPGARVVRGA